jgi:hypothetical protein
MKRLLIMMALSLGVMVCFAQKAKSKQQRQRRVQPVERKLFYCSCAYQSYGLPADVVSHCYYELIADKGKKPHVVYAEESRSESVKTDFPATEKDVAELYKILQDLKVEELDGYNVSEDMMGGTSYRIHVEFADGKQVTADWFTHAPKGEAVSAYETILRFLGGITQRKQKKKK